MLDSRIDANAVVLVGEPLSRSLHVNGLLSGRLELNTNKKKDFDFTVRLGGSYIDLPVRR